jgi:hypothetical protein
MVEKSADLPQDKIEKILRLPILKSLFENFEQQHIGDHDDTLKL